MYAFLLIGLVVIFLPLINRKRSVKELMTTVALYAAFAAAIKWSRDAQSSTPVGKFKNTYSAIRTGMTSAEIDAIIQRQFLAVRPSVRWSTSGGYINLGPVDPDYDAEVIGVKMSNGLVVSKEYLPD